MATVPPRSIPTRSNTYAPTGRDIENLTGGMLSGLLGIPGDIQALGQGAGNRLLGLLSQTPGMDPAALMVGLLDRRSAPTAAEIGRRLGANPESGAFFAGELGAPDPGDLRRLPGMLGMTFLHGSPHKWSKPATMEELGRYMGSGEGSQAFGWGMYLAENPGVAGSYRNAAASRGMGGVDLTLSGKADVSNDSFALLDEYYEPGQELTKEWFDGVLRSMEDNLARFGKGSSVQQRNIDELRRVGPDAFKPAGEGHLYEVDIPDEEIAKFLDWDRPLNEQSGNVQNAMREMFADRGIDFDEWVRETGGEWKDAWKNVFEDLDNRDLSAELLKRDIPGIRFLDSGSRGAAGIGQTIGQREKDILNKLMTETDPKVIKKLQDELDNLEDLPKGTRNIVVFNPDSVIKSVKRDGELVWEVEK